MQAHPVLRDWVVDIFPFNSAIEYNSFEATKGLPESQYRFGKHICTCLERQMNHVRTSSIWRGSV
jgi:hypothetical protein